MEMVMSSKAVILGGTGQIGTAIAKRLLADGWDVTVSHRGNRVVAGEGAAKVVRADRHEPLGVADAVGGGADLVVDVIGYTRRDAEALLSVCGDVGSVVAMSTAAVYVDADGREFNGFVAEEDFPRYPELIGEEQPTVQPGEDGYTAGKIAYEQTLLDSAPCPTTVFRLGAVSGPHSDHAREWFYVKRLLDGRRTFGHHRGGASVFHTTSVDNLAELVCVARRASAGGILNCADPTAHTEKEIAAAVADAMDVEILQVDVRDDGASQPCRSPWLIPGRLALDMRRAESLGYRPVSSYGDAVRSVVDWLVGTVKPDRWQDVLSVLASYPFPLFDYEAEDELLAKAGV
ncbi:NAD-dependent epimerase/dehydratase family protein [Lentzea sp. NPDC051208]|uniref:NAD-dependent epimerase/dehydratase family protein n=1 Tax=Lentzea sp. NPDC051208 TaxID=3154642 RepID=UPI00342A7B89